MNIYKVFTAPRVTYGQAAPQVTIYQIATMLAHQDHAARVEQNKTGKYNWYDESLVLIPQYISQVVEQARLGLSAHERRCTSEDSIAMLILSAGEENFAQWPIPGAIAVRYSTNVNCVPHEKCRAYQQALNNYWMDMETGFRLEQVAPDIKDYLYHQLPDRS